MPQRLKPFVRSAAYRSDKPLRHPKSHLKSHSVEMLRLPNHFLACCFFDHGQGDISLLYHLTGHFEFLNLFLAG